MVRTLIAGNWKMNGLRNALEEIEAVARKLDALPDVADCLICPPTTLLTEAAKLNSGRLKLGGQTCHAEQSGAHTGDISAEMLAEAGASYVIVGHSERRADHGETSEIVSAQANAALGAGLIPIICVGESLAERKAGQTLSVISRQVADSIPESAGMEAAFVVAYEPIWAIGTGEVASADQIGEVHAHIRSALMTRFGAAGEGVPLLYGGSMKPGNAAEIMAVEHVDGGLIGGASLKADDFMSIYSIAIGHD